MLDGSDVRRTAAACTDFLGAHVESDWSTAVPDLDMNVAEVVAHTSLACLWYSIDLAALGADLEPVEPKVTADGAAAELVATLTALASVVAAVIDAASDDARGFHPFGTADRSGFAAMACDEMLIHTHDVGRALGAAFTPPSDMVALVLDRLFPWADGADDPWLLLQWANGRIPLDGRPRLEGWRWHCSPLDEWDGQPPLP